jgi:hypothetical protein
MKPKFLPLLIVFVLTALASNAQTVVVTDDNSVTTGDASSVLDVKSTAKGFLAPRMTQAQRVAISSPATGLLVYQTDGTAGYYYYNGSTWLVIAHTTQMWLQDGNSLTGVKNFGTTSNHDLPFITNNTEHMRLTAGGFLGIGTTSAETPLHVKRATPTTGSTVVGLFEGTQDAGPANGVMLQLANNSSNSSKTFITLGHKSFLSNGRAWMIGNDAMGDNSQNFYVYDVAGSIARLYINGSGGYTGFGTPTPTALMHVKSNLAPTADIPLGLFEAEANPGGMVTFSINNTSATNYKTGLFFGNQVTPWVIGNDIWGNTDQNFYIYDNASFTTRLYIDNAGRVGLGGNITPTEELDVTGNAKFSGSITGGTWNGSAIGVTYGGTGQTTWTTGDLLYASAANTLSKLSGNSTTTTRFLSQTGTGSESAAPSWSTLAIGDIPDLSSLYGPAAGSSSITTVGTITSGTWNGTIISPTYGGTGINNGSRTITLGGNLTTSGANNVIFTTSGATNVTLPTTGTLVNTAVTSLSSLANVGTITSGTWNGTTIAVNRGGTGLTSYTTGSLLYASGATTIAEVAPNSTTTREFLMQTSSGAPSFETLTAADVPGALIDVRVLTTGTSYTPTAGTTQIYVIMIGGGGGGGGCQGNASQVGACGGGGSGSVFEGHITGVSSSTSYTYALGSGGVGGASSNDNGDAGTSTTLTVGATTYTAPGGSGGVHMTPGTSVTSVAGGAAGATASGGSGHVFGVGHSGGRGYRFSGTTGMSGDGANSRFGSGGSAGFGSNGSNASGYGAGGGGAHSNANTDRAGGSGTGGIIIIREYR